VVLLLDDVHWADPATADVLALLAHRPPRGRVLLALAARTGRAPALGAVVAAGERDGRAEVVELGPLGPQDAAELVPHMGRAARERLYRESGGNPFYPQELGRAAASTAPDGPPADRRRAWPARRARSCRAPTSDALLAAIPGARLVSYAGTGHCPHWEDVEAVAAELAAFCRDAAALPA